MELKVRISYSELFELIKQLPASQILQLKTELAQNVWQKPGKVDKSKLKDLLLHGPVMSNEQYENFLQTRNWMNEGGSGQ